MLDDTERRVYHGYNWPVSSDSLALHCAGLVKRYGDVTAVNGLDLHVVRGECFGLLGPNGAGKTTTIEILEGLLTADAGEVTVLGRRWDRDAAALRPRLGIQLQETQLADKLTVHETLRMFRSFYPEGPDVEALLDTVELTAKRDSWVAKLSGGQKQRLSVACALAGRPELLFLDEPTTGLDPQSRRQLWEVLERFREGGGTILITTHYMDEAHALCDRVGTMDQGQLIALGTPRELVQSLGAEHVVEFATIGPAVTKADLMALPGVRDARPAMSEAKCDPRPHLAESNGHDEKHTALSTSEVHLTVPALLDLLRRHDTTLSHLGTHSATLEDVFVTLTGRQLRDD
jgi:ABC-2 type transport system ATP-binding protein